MVGMEAAMIVCHLWRKQGNYTVVHPSGLDITGDILLSIGLDEGQQMKVIVMELNVAVVFYILERVAIVIVNNGCDAHWVCFKIMK